MIARAAPADDIESLPMGVTSLDGAVGAGAVPFAACDAAGADR
jgi:hypothetical protein